MTYVGCGGCTFVTKWDTPGVKIVTATHECGTAKQRQVTIPDCDPNDCEICNGNGSCVIDPAAVRIPEKLLQ